ncbi:unnamed protein product [Chironomus riparius]|uniref:Mediator of RNA polymerase II transcription subunit 20 n=1 Tax=Chironomus riparius TaxID=315576 RepID=A0A9N9RMI2_9DIPT|nr:unnamed protein product [Chironomus riparius]
MGVTILVPYPLDNKKTGPEVVEELSKRLLAMQATQTGHFLVDGDVFESSFNKTKIHVMHNSEYPASVFSILDNGQKQIPLITDLIFDLLMLKVNPIYASRKQLKIESKGPRFELGDFLVKLGSVTMSQSQTFKGLLIEVDYRPCLIPIICWELIREFLQGFLGQYSPTTIPVYFTNSVPNPHHPVPYQKSNDTYQPIDTVQQYLEHFNNYRKQTIALMMGPNK